MATPLFEPAKPRRAFDEIVTQVREMLRTGELVAGDRLPTERALIEQFAVSRGTVREALRMLEIAGLVELRPGTAGGAFVARADPSKLATSMLDMIELSQFALGSMFEARGWIEGVVVRVACARAADEDFDRLEANIAESARLADTGEWEKKAAVNVEFHNILADSTGNPFVVAIMRSLMEVMLKFVLALGPIDNAVVMSSRRKFMEHLRQRDADAAVAEMDRHLYRIHAMAPEVSN